MIKYSSHGYLNLVLALVVIIFFSVHLMPLGKLYMQKWFFKSIFKVLTNILIFFCCCSNKSVDFCNFGHCFIVSSPLLVQSSICAFCSYRTARICLLFHGELTFILALCATFQGCAQCLHLKTENKLATCFKNPRFLMGCTLETQSLCQ